MPKNATLHERFWEKVEKTENCWVWIGQRHSFGYGRIDVYQPSRKVHLAHRLSWVIHNGAIPKGAHVLHHCDNPPCVNPKHLFLGTQADNAFDMAQKNRNVKGEKFSRAKFTEQSINRIRRRYGEGNITQIQIAREFGVSQTQISVIVNRKAWKHVR